MTRPFPICAKGPLRIDVTVGTREISARIDGWACRFRDREMSVEDVQNAFAALTDEGVAALPPKLQTAIKQAKQELDAIRFGMCEAGQAGEIARIFQLLTSISSESHEP